MEGISVDGMKFKTHYDDADVNHRRQLMKISKAAQAAVRRIKAQGVPTHTEDVQLEGETKPHAREFVTLGIEPSIIHPGGLAYTHLFVDDCRMHIYHSSNGEEATWVTPTDETMVKRAPSLIATLKDVARKPSLKKRFWSAFTSDGN